ncbi:MAG: hypothetical protein AAF039_16045 [Bacteroidota bacterium]
MNKNVYSIFAIYITLFMMTSCNTGPKDIDNTSTVMSHKASKEIQQFGQLVGEWHCDVMNLLPDSTWKETKARWKFEYVLDGTAIQDYWEHPIKSSNDTIPVLLGTNLRIYNPVLEKWQCAWVENKNNSMSGIWEATMNDNNEIVMNDGTDNWEIKFYNIDADHFDWQWDFKQPSGEMKTMSKISAVRKK